MSEIHTGSGLERVNPTASSEQLDRLVQNVLEKIWKAELEPCMEVVQEVEMPDGTIAERARPVYRFSLDSLALRLTTAFQGWEEGEVEFTGPAYALEDGEEIIPPTLVFNLWAEDITADEYRRRDLEVFIPCSQDEPCSSQVSLSCYSDARCLVPVVRPDDVPIDDDRLRFDEASALAKIVDASL